MSDPYTPTTPVLVPGDVARAEDLNAKFAAQSTGWNRLPTPHPTLKGFNEAIMVGEPTMPGHATSKNFVETSMTSQVAQAAASATAAAASASAALTSQNAASASQTAAAASQTAAATSATNAASSATAAGTSATNAAASATSASGSASAASTSATNAANSASSAAGSATTASNAATSATASATSATASATSATNSAASATTSANSASTSASNAAGSASSAATSASNAATSATNAAASATSASGSASTATTQASNASASATLAQQWASNPEDVVVSGGLFSARHYALKAEASAAAAAGGGVSLTGNQSIAGQKTFTQVIDLGNTSALSAGVIVSAPNGAGNETKYPGIGFSKVSTYANYLYSDGVVALKMRGSSGVSATFWSDANDGAGSGLDADLLDGLQAASFARVAVSNTFSASNTFNSGTVQRFTSPSSPIANAGASLGTLEVYGGPGGGAAFMAFHRPASFASYFGLDTDNAWKVGGWSAGAVANRVWHEGIFALPVSTNTASTPVLRDASGNFSAGTITAALNGNASTATSATNATEASNAQTLQGRALSNAATANTVALRDTSGHLFAVNFNQASANNENPATVSQIMVTNGGDNFLRKASIAHVTSSLSGTAPIAITGNAATATALQTARTINGTSFNGTANITVTANTPNNLTFNNGGAGGASGSTFNGGAALTVSYNTVGAPSTTGVGASGTWGISITGNAATATSAASATSATSATTATTATNVSGGSVNATTGTFSGKMTVNNGAYTARTDLGSGLTTITPNGNSSNVQSAGVTASASVALPTNVADGQTVVTRITNSAAGAVTITFNASYRMPNGLKSFSLNASQSLLLSIVNVNGTYFATAANNMS